MPIEDEMRAEMKKLEKEIELIDDELEKLHNKILHLIMIRKKKERDLKVLRSSFGYEEEMEKEIQTTLAKLLKEKI
ncbi:MAG: hypothetical protein QXD48_00815 [Candidatus Aenigmatarchaeota archaeon]